MQSNFWRVSRSAWYSSLDFQKEKMEQLVAQLPKEPCSGEPADTSGRLDKQSESPQALGLEQGQSYLLCFPNHDHTPEHIAGSQ